jgi:hypothetical protein
MKIPVIGVLLSLFVAMPAVAQVAFDSETRWLLSVPAETPVRIKSDFGSFRVPIGYLTNRDAFRQNEFALSHGVALFDIADEQNWPNFAFNYWVPDGGMVWHAQPQIRDNRPREPGHPSPSSQDFVVLMDYVEPIAGQLNWQRAEIAQIPSALDKLIHVDLPGARFAYKGATKEKEHDSYLRFYVTCGAQPLCIGWLVIDRRDMAMRVIVPADALNSMFNAVRTAAGLLDTWQAPG